MGDWYTRLGGVLNTHIWTTSFQFRGYLRECTQIFWIAKTRKTNLKMKMWFSIIYGFTGKWKLNCCWNWIIRCVCAVYPFRKIVKFNCNCPECFFPSISSTSPACSTTRGPNRSLSRKKDTYDVFVLPPCLRVDTSQSGRNRGRYSITRRVKPKHNESVVLQNKRNMLRDSVSLPVLMYLMCTICIHFG